MSKKPKRFSRKETKQQPINGDNITVGDISNATVAIGRNANVEIDNETSYALSGDFREAILNIESTLRRSRQRVENLSLTDKETRDKLALLIDDLTRLLATVQPPQLIEAKAITEGMQELIVAADTKTLNKLSFESIRQHLKDNAVRLSQNVPSLISVTDQIVSIFANLTMLSGQ